MRVWLINHFAIPPSESGGTRHYSLARALSTHGIAASVIASASNYQTGQARPMPEGATAHRETINGVEFLWLRAAAHGKGASSRLLAMLDFAWKILRNVPGHSLAAPEVIVGSSPHLFAAAAACALAARLRVPFFVLEVRDLWPASLVEIAGYSRFHPIILLLLLLERYVYRRAARIITLLPDAAPYFTARGARAENIVVIPNGVDVDLLDAPLPPAPAQCSRLEASHSSAFRLLCSRFAGFSMRVGAYVCAYAPHSAIPIRCVSIPSDPTCNLIPPPSPSPCVFMLSLATIAKESKGI